MVRNCDGIVYSVDDSESTVLVARSIQIEKLPCSVYSFVFSTACMCSSKHLLVLLQIVWADNADFCAKQYTGTGALKTDFTRCVST